MTLVNRVSDRVHGAELRQGAGDGIAGRGAQHDPDVIAAYLGGRETARHDADHELSLLSKLRNIENYLRADHGHSRRQPRCAARQDRHRARRQRRRQDHGAEDDLRRSRSAEGHHRVRAGPIHAHATPTRSCGSGSATCPEGREVFPFLSVRENLMMGAYPALAIATASPHDLERVYGYFPRLQGAPGPARRAALGRRAADAGDQPRH